MGNLIKFLKKKFEEWAIGKFEGIFWQWAIVLSLRFASRWGCFNGTYETFSLSVNVMSTILDWLWYIDTAYLVTSLIYRTMFKRKLTRIRRQNSKDNAGFF
jgi:hypothetical protein